MQIYLNLLRILSSKIFSKSLIDNDNFLKIRHLDQIDKNDLKVHPRLRVDDKINQLPSTKYFYIALC